MQSVCSCLLLVTFVALASFPTALASCPSASPHPLKEQKCSSTDKEQFQSPFRRSAKSKFVEGPSWLRDSDVRYITCESWGYNPRRCSVGAILDTAYPVDVQGGRCELYATYFIGQTDIVVDGGCRAVFGYTVSFGALKPEHELVCESWDWQREECTAAGNIDYIYVRDQFSGSNGNCIPGYSYMTAGNQVVVDNGCRARFGYTLD